MQVETGQTFDSPFSESGSFSWSGTSSERTWSQIRRRRHLLREANDLIAIILDTRDYVLSNSIAFGNYVSRADL